MGSNFDIKDLPHVISELESNYYELRRSLTEQQRRDSAKRVLESMELQIARLRDINASVE